MSAPGACDVSACDIHNVLCVFSSGTLSFAVGEVHTLTFLGSTFGWDAVGLQFGILDWNHGQLLLWTITNVGWALITWQIQLENKNTFLNNSKSTRQKSMLKPDAFLSIVSRRVHQQGLGAAHKWPYYDAWLRLPRLVKVEHAAITDWEHEKAQSVSERNLKDTESISMGTVRYGIISHACP